MLLKIITKRQNVKTLKRLKRLNDWGFICRLNDRFDNLDGVDALFDNDFSLFIGAKPPVAWLPRSDAEWKELSEQEQKTVRVKDRRLHLTVELENATSWLASAKVTRLLVRILTFVDVEMDAQSLCGQGHYHAVSRPHCRWLHRQGPGARAGQCRGRGSLDPGEVFKEDEVGNAYSASA